MKKNFIWPLIIFLLSATLLLTECAPEQIAVFQTDMAMADNTPAEGDDIQPSDYAQQSNWMMLPGSNDKPADVFYFYPTAWGASKDGSQICTIDYRPMRRRAEAVAQKQATAFSAAGNIYAPYYRQVDASFALSKPLPRQTGYFNGIPKTDAVEAFDYYIKHYNEGRPFILVGHSQGALMVKALLFDYLKENPEVNERMIAAYVIGYSITEDELEANPHLKFAEGAGDTGVIISYNTESAVTRGPSHTLLPGAMAINPITWSRGGETAPASLSLGSLMPAQNGKEEKVMNFADATVNVKRGTVVCSTVDPREYHSANLTFFPQGIFHRYDFAFYYYNLKQNAEYRTACYFKENNR